MLPYQLNWSYATTSAYLAECDFFHDVAVVVSHIGTADKRLGKIEFEVFDLFECKDPRAAIEKTDKTWMPFYVGLFDKDDELRAAADIPDGCCLTLVRLTRAVIDPEYQEHFPGIVHAAALRFGDTAVIGIAPRTDAMLSVEELADIGFREVADVPSRIRFGWMANEFAQRHPLGENPED